MLPPRVQSTLNNLQYKSEFVVAGMQIAVIVLFYFVNYFSPAGYTPDSPVHSTPLGLYMFTVLVLLRLWLAYTKQLTNFLLGILVISEMALLLFTIWTYAQQFETTPVANLKNPHLFYIFILIALRALRFEPIWVLLSGATAIIGYSFILYVILRKEGMDVITWDYMTYVSTPSLYPTAEFDKLLAMFLVTIITAVSLYRARKTLTYAVSQTYATRDLSRFFDNDVAQRIISEESALTPGHGDIRDAAILFIDIRGFTKASEFLSTDQLISLLHDYQKLIVPIVQKHHGAIDKFLGDGIMVSFGAVIPNDTYAADAIYAVDEIMQKVGELSDKYCINEQMTLGIGAGLASGKVIFGVIGDENRLEYTVIGEAANLAAKLEKHNKIITSRALTTQETYNLAIKQGYIGSDKKILQHALVDGVSQQLDLVVIS
jgi:adenylate cyclase